MVDTVYIDDRENSRIKYAQKYWKNSKHKINNELPKTEVKHMEYGDFVYKNVAIEYKTVEDFIGSLKDHRVKRQAIMMQRIYAKSYIVIEGDYQKAINNLHYNGVHFSVKQYLGGIASISQIVPILQVNNKSQAFTIMTMLFAKSTDGKIRNIPDPEVRTKDKIVNFLCLSGGINQGRASKIVEELKLRTLHDLLNCSKGDFMKVSGIGNKTAQNIMKWIK